MGTENTEPTTSPEELQTGQRALEQLLAHYREIPAARVNLPRIDVRRAAIVALGVSGRVNEPEWRALFCKLPPEKFDVRTLDLLGPAARAVIFARSELAMADALATDAKLPKALAQEASEVRGRMLKLAEFHLDSDEETKLVLDHIRAGFGYLDLAEDLRRLSGLYRANLELLSRDPSHFFAEDPGRADRLATDIDVALGIGAMPKEDLPRDILARAWTFLNTTYEHIARPGRWLFHDCGGDELFVSLVGAGRRPPTRRNDSE